MSQLDEYLASDEEMLLSFSATDVTRKGGETDTFLSNLQAGTGGYQFGATDRRIIYLTTSDDFKDIDYGHISSIETNTEEDTPVGPVLVGCCGGLLMLSGLVSLLDDPMQSLFGLLLGGVILFGAVKWGQRADTSKKQKITFITGDEAHQRIELTVKPDSDVNIGAELSRILREQRS
jgi:hypothetical protein